MVVYGWTCWVSLAGWKLWCHIVCNSFSNCGLSVVESSFSKLLLRVLHRSSPSPRQSASHLVLVNFWVSLTKISLVLWSWYGKSWVTQRAICNETLYVACLVVFECYFCFLKNLPGGSGPIPDVLQYRANPWGSRSKLLHLPPVPKISLISMSPDGGRIRY